MSEPWAHPERAAIEAEKSSRDAPERVSISESAQAQSAPQQTMPPTEQMAPPQQTGPQPVVDSGPQPMVDSGPQPTVPLEQQHSVTHDYQPTQQYSSEQQQFGGAADGHQHAVGGPAEPQYAPQHAAGPQYAQPHYAQPQYVPPKKKSGVFGLIGLLLVLGGNILVFVAVVLGFSNFELSEEYLEDLANANTASLILLIVAILAWLLGSLICVISLAARRGVVASAIGLILVLIPSWLLALTLLAAATGSTAMLHLLIE